MYTIDKPRMISPEEVAERMSVKYRTVITWLQTGQLKGSRVGKHWRIEQDAVEEFIRRGSNRRHTQAS